MSSTLGVMSSLAQSVKPSSAASAPPASQHNSGKDKKPQEGGGGKGKAAYQPMTGSPTFYNSQSIPTLEELGEWMPPAAREERRKIARHQGQYQSGSSGVDPLSALTGGVSLGGDTQPKSRNTVDTTDD